MRGNPEPTAGLSLGFESKLESVATSDGVRLAVHRLGAGGAVPVVMIPGVFSNHTFWTGTRGAGFARTVAEADYEAWVLDLRGHGQSDRPAPGPRWSFDDWARCDIPAVVEAVTAARQSAFLIGHSAGGAAILAALAGSAGLAERTRGLVIAATPAPQVRGLRAAGARLLWLLSVLFPRFPARLLRFGPEDEVAGVMAEWMRWNLEGAWRGRDGTDYTRLLSRVQIPALFLAGSGDRLFAPPEDCRKLLDTLGSLDKTFLECGRATGFSEDFDHPGLLASRAAREEVWPRIVGWMEERRC